MGSSDELDDDTSRSVMRASRAASRRELIQSKRTRQTDMLPEINQPEGSGKLARVLVHGHLHEENLHLHRELEMLQAQMEVYQSSVNVLEEELEATQQIHQQEIEQYQQQIREMMDEHNHMQETIQQWEHRYQETYRDFQNAVEDEANKLIKEATQTLVLAPEHTPALLSDVVQTLEGQLRQGEDQRTAELLEVMRQAQYKAELLEREVAHERAELAAEREHVRQRQVTVDIQAQQRYQLERARLQGRWTAGLTVVSMFLLLLMVGLELILHSLNVALFIILFVPLGICLALSYVFAHLHTSGRIHVQSHSEKPPTKTPKLTKPVPQRAR